MSVQFSVVRRLRNVNAQNTDTKRALGRVLKNIYCFLAINIDAKDVAMFYGVNERLVLKIFSI